jgi:hypothetical protein
LEHQSLTLMEVSSMSSCVTKAALCAVLSLAASPAFAANLLVNPGFETGNFFGWTVSGTSPNFGVGTNGQLITGTHPFFGSTSVETHSGTYAGYAVICNAMFFNVLDTCVPSGNPLDYLDLTQTLAVVPGATYTVSFFLGTQSPDTLVPVGYGDGTMISVNGVPILSRDGTCSPFIPPVVPCVPSTGFIPESATFVASGPSATVDFHILGSGIGDAGFSFDDFDVEPVPEPSSLTLLALGLLSGIALCRRHGVYRKLERGQSLTC